jgi:hypothetical protein
VLAVYAWRTIHVILYAWRICKGVGGWAHHQQCTDWMNIEVMSPPTIQWGHGHWTSCK